MRFSFEGEPARAQPVAHAGSAGRPRRSLVVAPPFVASMAGRSAGASSSAEGNTVVPEGAALDAVLVALVEARSKAAGAAPPQEQRRHLETGAHTSHTVHGINSSPP